MDEKRRKKNSGEDRDDGEISEDDRAQLERTQAELITQLRTKAKEVMSPLVEQAGLIAACLARALILLCLVVANTVRFAAPRRVLRNTARPRPSKPAC